MCPVTMAKSYLKIACARAFVTLFLFCKSSQNFSCSFSQHWQQRQACSDFMVTENQGQKFEILPDDENEYKKHDKLKRLPRHELDCSFVDIS